MLAKEVLGVEMPSKTEAPLALFDMDGTLFDYEGQLRRDLERIKSPGEIIPEDLWDEKIPWLKARMNLIKSQPGWWRDLPLLEDGLDILNLAANMGFNCHVLTKGPDSKPQAWAEKVECIRHHGSLGTIPNVGIDIVGTNSGSLIPQIPKSGRYGHILVDDYPEYVSGWLQYRPRGLAILPSQPYNINFEHPNAIRYNGSAYSFRKVAAYFEAVLARKPGEHWKDHLKPESQWKDCYQRRIHKYQTKG